MQPSLNREYKKGKPFRDFRKFFIVCEGEREGDYFSFFDKKSRKLVVTVSTPIDEYKGESAPNKLLERAEEHINKNGWDENFQDQLWFVLDVDKWKREAIELLKDKVKEYKNWGIAISNPCFEVWLYYHLEDKIPETPSDSKQMKQMLHQQINGRYKLEKYAIKIDDAIINSQKNDMKPQTDYPDVCVTKVYLLANEILPLLKKVDGKINL